MTTIEYKTDGMWHATVSVSLGGRNTQITLPPKTSERHARIAATVYETNFALPTLGGAKC